MYYNFICRDKIKKWRLGIPRILFETPQDWETSWDKLEQGICVGQSAHTSQNQQIMSDSGKKLWVLTKLGIKIRM